MAVFEENNSKFKTHVADLANDIASKSEEIRGPNTESEEGLDQIRIYIDNPGDVVNKSQLFENELKSDGHIPR